MIPMADFTAQSQQYLQDVLGGGPVQATETYTEGGQTYVARARQSDTQRTSMDPPVTQPHTPAFNMNVSQISQVSGFSTISGLSAVGANMSNISARQLSPTLHTPNPGVSLHVASPDTSGQEASSKSPSFANLKDLIPVAGTREKKASDVEEENTDNESA